MLDALYDQTFILIQCHSLFRFSAKRQVLTPFSPSSLFFIQSVFCTEVFHFVSFILSFLAKCLLRVHLCATDDQFKSLVVHRLYLLNAVFFSPTLCKTVSLGTWCYIFQLICSIFLHIHISVVSSHFHCRYFREYNLYAVHTWYL